MRNKKSKKSVFVTWMKYLIGIFLFGICFLLLLDGVKLNLFIPFKEEFLEATDIYAKERTLYNLAKMERSAGFLKFVLLRAIAIPSIFILGMNAVGLIITTVKKLVGGKRGFNIAVWVIVVVAFSLETISIMKVVWKEGGVFNNILQSFLYLFVFLEIFTFMLSPFFFSLSKKSAVKDYLCFIGVILLFLCGFLAVEFLFAYWEWTVLSTIMQLLLLLVLILGMLAFPFFLFGAIFYDEEKTVASTSYSSNSGSYSNSSYGNSYNSYGNSSQSAPKKRNIYSHYETKVSCSIIQSNDNGTYVIDYDATFYFKNDDGDVETKGACGRFDGITSSYVSASDVEYRHSYMLNDYEK